MTEMQTWTFAEFRPPEDGPWDEEPDKAVWVDPPSDLDCMIHRSGLTGALCGYVGVPAGHPWHGKRAGDIEAHAHGGINYAAACDPDADENGVGICHVPAPGRPHDVWWVGFDCGHHMDLCPTMTARLRQVAPDLAGQIASSQTYRTFAYVKGRVEELAAQAVLAASR